MIKTQHVRLNSAADLLGVDSDLILISAAEGGVQIYALLNDWRYVSPNIVPDDDKKTNDVIFSGPELFENTPIPFPVKKYFKFIRIGSYDASSILKSGATVWQGGICTEPDEKGVFWETVAPTSDLVEMMREGDAKSFKLRKKEGDEIDNKDQRCIINEFESYEPVPLFIRKDDLFIRSVDLEKIMSGQSAASKLPDKEPVKLSPQQRGGLKKMEDTHEAFVSSIVFGLSEKLGRKLTVSDVVDYAERGGFKIGETKARSILKEYQ